MIYRAKYVVPVCGEIIRDGAVRVRDKLITGVDTFKRLYKKEKDDVTDCRPWILMPGLINCHVHLEEGVARNLAQEPSSFANWFARTNHYLSNSDIVRRFQAVRLGVRECLFNGITTVADVAGGGSSLIVLQEEPVRSIIFLQFRGLVPWDAQQIFSQEQKRLLLYEKVFGRKNTGFCPNAPYSTSIELYREAIKASRDKDILFQTHLAESSEELEMFSSKSGPLYEFMQREHEMDLNDYSKGSSFFMIKNNLLPTNSMVVHGNYLSSDEFEILSRRKISLVHCAQSHRFFGHKPFPFETVIGRKVNVCLGSEGLGSVPALSLFDEMNCIKQAHPELEGKKILEFATLNGAKALGMQQRIGALAEGLEADMIGIRLTCDDEDDLYESIVLEEPRVEFVMVRGVEVLF